MGTTIRTAFLAAVFITLYVWQWNMDSDLTVNRIIKNNLELAVHDASLDISTDGLSEGYIVFDKVESIEVLKESLKHSLKLDENLIPIEQSFLQDEVKVLFLDFVDEQTLSPNNPGEYIEFPYVYTNGDYQILEVLNGPSVIAVLETQSPRYFSGEKKTITKAAVYEYPMNIN